MTAVVIRSDARALPLADNSVDLIVTSPPYWKLRDYRDRGQSVAGQLGTEDTPANPRPLRMAADASPAALVRIVLHARSCVRGRNAQMELARLTGGTK